jgi:hypothetical protein
VSNVVENGVAIGSLGSGEAVWHSDMTYIPPAGGDTSFCSMYGAWDRLSIEVRRRLTVYASNMTPHTTAAGTSVKASSRRMIRGRHRVFGIHWCVCTQRLGAQHCFSAGDAMRTSTASMKGQTVSHYHIGDQLGRGGMGVVYRVEGTRLSRTIALPDEPALAELWPKFSWLTTIPSDPPGARVFRRSHSAKTDDWEELGTTPLEKIPSTVRLVTAAPRARGTSLDASTARWRHSRVSRTARGGLTLGQPATCVTPFFKLLGTADADKTNVVAPGGHFVSRPTRTNQSS